MDIANIFEKATISEMVHLCIDLQKTYIGENEKDIERLVARTVAPRLLDSGIPTYWIYYEVNTPSAFTVGGYRGIPQTSRNDLSNLIGRRIGYHFLPKFEKSAMSSDCIKNTLNNEGKKALIISGLTYPFCVADTASEAIKQGYKVILMIDGTDYDECYQDIDDQLRNMGVVFSNTTDVLAAAQQANQNRKNTPVYTL